MAETQENLLDLAKELLNGGDFYQSGIELSQYGAEAIDGEQYRTRLLAAVHRLEPHFDPEGA